MMCHGEDIQINKYLNYGIRRDKKINKIIKFWLPKADTLIANSESIIIAEYNKIKVKKIELIPFGIDLKRVNNYSVKKKFENFSAYLIKVSFLCLGKIPSKKKF